MTGYRRWRRKGGTYFFTVCLAARGSDLLLREVGLLREVVRLTRADRPFDIEAFVVLPDHLHSVWRLSEGDDDFSTRWGAIKGRFSRAVRESDGPGPGPVRRSPSKLGKGEAGIWQRRFWEHLIRDADDHARHVGYCWIDPVRHGLAARARDWPWSSFHREVRRGAARRRGGGLGRGARRGRLRRGGPGPARWGATPSYLRRGAVGPRLAGGGASPLIVA